MRYTANVLAPRYADEDTLDAERFRKRMAKAQDRLGAINDLVVAETIMENVGLATRERQAADLLLQEAREARKALIQRIPRLLKKLRGTKPFCLLSSGHSLLISPNPSASSVFSDSLPNVIYSPHPISSPFSLLFPFSS